MPAKRRQSPRLEALSVPRAAPSGRETLADEVYRRLKDDIFEFRMPPGQRYSEQELASSLGVSRTPLRFALHVLAHQGYLERLEGHSSWQVKPLDLDYYEDLYEFRLSIELNAMQRICKLDALDALLELGRFWRVAKAQRVLDGARFAAEDERFHRGLVALAGNQAMLRTFDDLTERIRIIRRLDFVDPARIEAAFEEHGKILQMLLARKAASAEILMRAHIGSSRTEIRHITLHRLALAGARRERALISL